MKYDNGKDVRAGDIIDLGDNTESTVLCIIEDNSAVDGYDIKPWLYLEYGAIVVSDNYGEMRIVSFDQHVDLIRREIRK